MMMQSSHLIFSGCRGSELTAQMLGELVSLLETAACSPV